jgi:hypothetical protein
MRKTFLKWWEGEYVPPKNDPNSPLHFVMGSYKRHWTASAARRAVQFYMREWKWTLGAAAAVIGALVLKR